MFGDDESDNESIPSEKEQVSRARHGYGEAVKKGVVRPFSHILDPLTSGCDPVADLCCSLISCILP